VTVNCLQTLCSELKEAIISSEFPSAVDEALYAGMVKEFGTGWPEHRFAVRSSAIGKLFLLNNNSMCDEKLHGY